MGDRPEGALVTGGIEARFVEVEADFLRELVEQYRELVVERPASDPALARLAPAAYRDDAAAAEEFSALTRDDLLSGRAGDADRVLADLRQAGRDAHGDSLVHIADDAGPAWLRTLNGLRLVLAVRMGIEDDDTAEEDPRHDAYEWLGYRLELLVEAMPT